MIYALQLLPPRPDFPQTMTETEQAVMAEHAAYWRGLLADGVAVVFGPVLDPSGAYGLAVVDADQPEQVERVIAADPAVRHGLVPRYHPMPGAVVRPATLT